MVYLDVRLKCIDIFKKHVFIRLLRLQLLTLKCQCFVGAYTNVQLFITKIRHNWVFQIRFGNCLGLMLNRLIGHFCKNLFIFQNRN